jgi:hypothetical protein
MSSRITPCGIETRVKVFLMAPRSLERTVLIV